MKSTDKNCVVVEIDGELCLAMKDSGRVLFVLQQTEAKIIFGLNDVARCEVSFICKEPVK